MILAGYLAILYIQYIPCTYIQSILYMHRSAQNAAYKAYFAYSLEPVRGIPTMESSRFGNCQRTESAVRCARCDRGTQVPLLTNSFKQ